MKHHRLTIRIKCPPEDLFTFFIDPRNTPRWIDFLVAEETSEWPVRLGTIYRNQNAAGEWRTYTVTAFEPAKLFELSKAEDSYHVRYTLQSVKKGEVELRYFECVDAGELTAPFEQIFLQKLKTVVEKE